jgi:hypothetical protein
VSYWSWKQQRALRSRFFRNCIHGKDWETMRKHVLAAISAALLMGLAGDAWAQLGHTGDGRNRWISINNNSGHTVLAIYAVPSYTNRNHIDSPDFIPNDVILPGRYLRVNFDLGNGECLLDIRASGSNGRDWVARSVNVCTESGWNLVN